MLGDAGDVVGLADTTGMGMIVMGMVGAGWGGGGAGRGGGGGGEDRADGGAWLRSGLDASPEVR